jgi:predicted permease
MATMTDPGFDLQRTIWAQMRLVPGQYGEPGEIYRFASTVLERLRATPGVEAATYTSVVPLTDQSNNTGRVATDTDRQPVTLRYQVFVVTEDFFRTMDIPIRAGREFRAADRRGGPRLVIINEAFAKQVFGSLQPLGHTVDFGGEKITVIGVAANSKYVSLGEDETPAIYEPFVEQQAARANLSFLIRSTVPPSALTRTITREMLAIDADAAVEVKPMNQAMGFAMLPSRVGAGLLGAIGALGLALAAIGLFGVLSYSVSRRVQEIGLRMALGAGTADIVRLVIREGAWIVGCGLTAGLALAVFITKPLSMFLVAGLSPTDPSTYAAVAGVLILVGCVACVKPAMRALKSDPAVALRVE